jgi:hypothetical protein
MGIPNKTIANKRLEYLSLIINKGTSEPGRTWHRGKKPHFTCISPPLTQTFPGRDDFQTLQDTTHLINLLNAIRNLPGDFFQF